MAFALPKMSALSVVTAMTAAFVMSGKSVEAGWEPLCKFLGKDKPLPTENDSKAFENREQELMKEYGMRPVRNLATFMISVTVVLIGAYWKLSNGQPK